MVPILAVVLRSNTLPPGSVITGKQDLLWQSTIVENSTNQESSGCFAASGGDHDWTLSNSTWCFYRRLASRLDKAKAVTATARKIAVLFHNVLRYGWVYQDPGADYYEEHATIKVFLETYNIVRNQ